MASAVQICNIALTKIGAEGIMTLLEDSESGRSCNLIYDDFRQALLRSHLWNFAINRKQLGQLASSPAFRFNFQYQLPPDFLKLAATNIEFEGAAYKIEGSKLLTNEAAVAIEYVADIIDPNLFDSLFREVLSLKIAAHLAISLADSASLSDAILNEYRDKLADSRTTDAQEGSSERFIDSTWLEARI